VRSWAGTSHSSLLHSRLFKTHIKEQTNTPNSIYLIDTSARSSSFGMQCFAQSCLKRTRHCLQLHSPLVVADHLYDIVMFI
jgi:hypothetical protein